MCGQPFHVAYSPRDEGDVQGDPGDISFKRANPYRLFPPNPIGTLRCRANRRNQETRRRSVSREASQATDIQHVTYESPRLECVSRVEQLIFPVFQPWKLYLTVHPAVYADQKSCFVRAGAMSMQEFHNRCCSSPKWSRPRDPFRVVSCLIYAPELRASCRKNCHQ